ncbi:MAG: YfhO family protein, partial [Eubacteriales bacterium]
MEIDMNNENSTDILSESGGNGGGDSSNTTKKDGGTAFFNPLRFLRRLQNRIARSPSSYLAYAFIIPTIIMLLVYICMELHPFGDGSVLVLDLNAQYVYFFEALRNFVRGDAELLYSFSRALGGEFMGIYAYYLASPLSYIVALFPTERMLEAMLVLILTKTGLCGFTFGFYLHRHSEHPNKLAVIAFSSMYALSAYAVVYQSNVMWTDALIWLPIICYSIEQLIKFRRYKLFVISLSVAVMSNFYIGYMLCIFVAVYFFYYFIAYNDGRNNPLGEKSHFLRSLLRIGVFSAIAVAISAVIIMTAYYSLTFGKTTFSDPNWAFSENFKPIDFLTKFLPGSYDTVRPEGLPFVYCGTLALILLPVYFMAKNIPSREKIASIVLIMFFVISFMASPLDLIWHGFQRPNWLNYRYSFMLVFILLVLAYKGFGNLRHIGEKFLLGVSAIIVLFAAVCQKLEFESYVESDSKLLSLETVWFTVIAVTCFLVLLCLLIRIKNVKKRENICGVLAALVCVELFCSSLACVVQYDKDVAYSRYSGYNNFLSELRPIVETVNENDPSFYRMEKNAHRKVNDNMALGIKGLTNSTSTLNSS